MSTEVFQIIPLTPFGADLPVKTRSGRVKRIYRCRHCARNFKRSEHCTRHERVHTQERPFPCGFCERRYARKDLVKRHERTLHAEAYRIAHPDEFQTSPFHMIDGSTATEIDAFVGRQSVASTASRTSFRFEKSTLTPPTEVMPVNGELRSDLCSSTTIVHAPLPMVVGSHDIPTTHVPSSTDFQGTLSSSTSTAPLLGQDGQMMLVPLGDEPFISHIIPNGDDYDILYNLSTPQPQEFTLGTEEQGPPQKRRGIDVDPLLLLDEASLYAALEL